MEIGSQPNRQRRQWLAERHRIVPKVNERALLDSFAIAKRDGVYRRRFGAEFRIAETDQIKQLGIEVELANRNDIDNRHAHVFLKQGGNFGDERSSALDPVLI